MFRKEVAIMCTCVPMMVVWADRKCAQCVIDEVDTKLEDLLNSVKYDEMVAEWIKDRIQDIKYDLAYLVSC